MKDFINVLYYYLIINYLKPFAMFDEKNIVELENRFEPVVAAAATSEASIEIDTVIINL